MQNVIGLICISHLYQTFLFLILCGLVVVPPEMEKGMVIFFKKGHFSARISKSKTLWALLLVGEMLVGASTVGILYCFSVFQ